jgi:hypothetical protein
LAGLRCVDGKRKTTTTTKATEGGDNNTTKQSPSVLDGLLDGMMAGRKLRRWYGQSDEPMLPTNRPAEVAEENPAIAEPDAAAAADDDTTPRTAVLVTGADSPTGELVVLQLLLAGASSGGIRAVVSDVAAAKTAYAEYVEPVQAPSGGAGPAAALAARRLLKGVAAVVCAGPLPNSLLEACAATNAGGKQSGVKRLVVLSTVGAARQKTGLAAALFGGGGGGGSNGNGSDDAAMADSGREATARAAAGVAAPSVVVVRAAGGVRDAPGAGLGGLSVAVGGGGGAGADSAASAVASPISREDLALVAARLGVEAASEEGNALVETGVLEVVVRAQEGGAAGGAGGGGRAAAAAAAAV